MKPLILPMVLLIQGIVAGQTPGWLLRSFPLSPAPRFKNALVFDSARRRVVLFGGNGKGGMLNDTWEYDGKSWVNIVPALSPSKRGYLLAAYDRARKVTVMFGGHEGPGSNHWLNDTWEYGGGTWRKKTIVGLNPSGRIHQAMVYDSGRKKIVMFGGEGSGYSALGDTWEYDGTSWVLVNTKNSPSPRKLSAMAYDVKRNKVVLFGGNSGAGLTWEYDGVDWFSKKTSTSPTNRTHHTMSFDSFRNVTILFGGDITAVKNDTWEYDGANWTRANPISSPTNMANHAMTYDSWRKTIVVFGGQVGLSNSWKNTTWEYSSPYTRGNTMVYGKGCGVPELSIDAKSGSLPLVGKNFLIDIKNLPSTASASLLVVGINNKSMGGWPLPLPLMIFGMTGCYLYCDMPFHLPYSPPLMTNQLSLPIPSSSAFINTNFYLQYFVAVPKVNFAGLISSNGLEILIGK